MGYSVYAIILLEKERYKCEITERVYIQVNMIRKKKKEILKKNKMQIQYLIFNKIKNVKGESGMQCDNMVVRK